MKGKAAEAGTAPTATGAAFVCADADMHTYAPTAPMHLLPYAVCRMPYAVCTNFDILPVVNGRASWSWHAGIRYCGTWISCQ